MIIYVENHANRLLYRCPSQAAVMGLPSEFDVMKLPYSGNNKRERLGRVFINKLFSKELSQVHDVLVKLLSRCLCFSILDVHQKHVQTHVT